MITKNMIDSVATSEIVEIADKTMAFMLERYQDRIGQKDKTVTNEVVRLHGRGLQAALVKFGRVYLQAERDKAGETPAKMYRPKPFPAAASIAAYAKGAIVDDCVSGLVPRGRITKFNDLYEHVDANDYLGIVLPKEQDDLESALRVCDEAIEMVNSWIRSGGLSLEVSKRSDAWPR